MEAERAFSNFDQRHVMAAQFEYTSGGSGAYSGLLSGWRRLLTGWTFAGQFSTGTGLPLTPVYLTPVRGTGITGTTRASLTGTRGEPLAGYYFDPTAFEPPPLGEWGNAKRNSLRGPAPFSLNMSIARTFPAGNRLNVDWRLEATNVLNRVTYSGVNVLVASQQFGLPNRAYPMRRLQTGATLKF